MDMQRVARVAALVKGKLVSDMALRVQRDRSFLAAICRELQMEASEVNQTFVASLLHVMGIATHEEYPKHLADSNAPGGFVVVNSAAEESNERARLQPNKPSAPDLSAQVNAALNKPAPSNGDE